MPSLRDRMGQGAFRSVRNHIFVFIAFIYWNTLLIKEISDNRKCLAIVTKNSVSTVL